MKSRFNAKSTHTADAHAWAPASFAAFNLIFTDTTIAAVSVFVLALLAVIVRIWLFVLLLLVGILLIGIMMHKKIYPNMQTQYRQVRQICR